MKNTEQTRRDFDRYIEKKEEILIKNKKIRFINLKKILRPTLRFALHIQRIINKQTVEFINKDIPKTDKKIVFVVSHIGKWDFEIINEQIKQHFHIIASDYMNMHKTFGETFMKANGVIFVDIDNKKDRMNSQEMMNKVLKQNDNMMIFPEGTWNLSENNIINDIHFGAVEIALKNDAVIVPIALEQYDKRFVINIGNLFDPSDVMSKYTDSKYDLLIDESMKFKIKLEANKILRDKMATLKYEIWNQQGVVERNKIPYDYWKEFINERCAEWPGYSMSEQYRNGCFPREKKEYYNMINELSKMKINKNNEFLFMNKDEFVKTYTKRR